VVTETRPELGAHDGTASSGTRLEVAVQDLNEGQRDSARVLLPRSATRRDCAVGGLRVCFQQWKQDGPAVVRHRL